MSTKATKRRTKGEGSITKTTSGTYRVRIDCGYIGGKRKQLSATCTTLVEARAKLREFEKLREEINIPVSTQMTFKQLFDKYIEYKTQRGDVKPTTLNQYNNNLRATPDILMNLPLIKITPTVMMDVINTFKSRGNKESTINTKLLFYKGVFKFAIKKLKLLQTSPLDDVSINNKKVLKLDVEILSEQEHKDLRTYLAKQYQDEVKEGRLYPSALGFTYLSYMLAYELGLREAEVVGLKWSRINFDQNTIIIDNQRIRLPKQGTFDATPKTVSSQRILVVSKGLIKILAEHRINYPFKDDYVFSKGHNKVLSISSIIGGFQKALAKVGITRHFTFHMIRHTNATRLIELSGNDYKTVSERLGHSSVSVTFDVYAHAIKKQHQLAAQLMDCTKDSCHKAVTNRRVKKGKLSQNKEKDHNM